MPRPDPAVRSSAPAGSGASGASGASGGKTSPGFPAPGGEACRTSASRRWPMLHGFRPGRATAGTAALATTLLFAGDAAGSWSTPWFVVFPVVFGGLAVAGALGLAHYGLRRRRLASSASTENSAAPPSTSGSQAMR
ncbi:hypothetical protein ABZ714_05875 [Streptomyces sp. NPDC006798]|uniref:hypothetical protein n=1 Tax=Streptomyces sp. NPDC006798 TaxID=3155462 RepID=UPI003400F250